MAEENSDDSSVEPPKKIEDDFKDYDEEADYDDEDEEEPYIPPQIGGTSNQFTDFRAESKGFDAVPSTMANQYLFAQPSTA